ncbi:MAG: TonB family protein [Blastocatellia bacterium]|nr:TonB family protein [Blastocatellia bacterium]
MNTSMQSRDLKTPLRNILLRAIIALAFLSAVSGQWSVVSGFTSLVSRYRDDGPRATDYRLATTDNEERNIEKQAVKRVQPPYPSLAQKYKIEGVVTVQVTVGGDGKVEKAEFVRGHNVFRSVSLDAAKRWEFRLSGEKTLEGTIRFIFKLND